MRAGCVICISGTISIPTFVDKFYGRWHSDVVLRLYLLPVSSCALCAAMFTSLTPSTCTFRWVHRCPWVFVLCIRLFWFIYYNHRQMYLFHCLYLSFKIFISLLFRQPLSITIYIYIYMRVCVCVCVCVCEHLSMGLKNANSIFWRRVANHKWGVLDMTLSYIWCWDFNSGALSCAKSPLEYHYLLIH